MVNGVIFAGILGYLDGWVSGMFVRGPVARVSLSSGMGQKYSQFLILA